MNKTHGLSHTPEYYIWYAMVDRCTNSKSNNYFNYGGRGITVCNEWKDNVSTFYKDMGKRPSDKHSIERINNNKGYYLSNCKWATIEEQAKNKRDKTILFAPTKNNNSKICGVSYHQRDKVWRAKIRTTYLGWSKDFFEACCLRKSAEHKYGRE